MGSSALSATHRSSSQTGTRRFRPRRIIRSCGATFASKKSGPTPIAAAASEGVRAIRGMDAGSFFAISHLACLWSSSFHRPVTVGRDSPSLKGVRGWTPLDPPGKGWTPSWEMGRGCALGAADASGDLFARAEECTGNRSAQALTAFARAHRALPPANVCPGSATALPGERRVCPCIGNAPASKPECPGTSPGNEVDCSCGLIAPPHVRSCPAAPPELPPRAASRSAGSPRRSRSPGA